MHGAARIRLFECCCELLTPCQAVALPARPPPLSSQLLFRLRQLPRSNTPPQPPHSISAQEWEAEDNEETHREVCHLLERVVRRCAKADSDFWPQGVTAAVFGGDGSVTPAGSSAAAGDIWALLGLDGSTEAAEPVAQQAGGAASSAVAAGSTDATAAHFADEEAAQLLRFQSLADERAQQEAGALRLAALPAAASQQAQRGAQVVVVSCGAACMKLSSCCACGSSWRMRGSQYHRKAP